MTARDRKMVLWLRDFMDNELGVVEYQPTIRRLTASRTMLERWLTADDKRRAKRGDGDERGGAAAKNGEAMTFHIEDLVYWFLIGMSVGGIATHLMRPAPFCATETECRAKAEGKRSQEMAKEFGESMNRSQR